jgi:hypothetical protein
LGCLETVRAEQLECLQHLLPEDRATAAGTLEPPVAAAPDTVPTGPIQNRAAPAATDSRPKAASSEADTKSPPSDVALPSDRSAEVDGSVGDPRTSETVQPAQAVESIGQATETQSAGPAKLVEEVQPAQGAEADEPATTGRLVKVDPPSDDINVKTEETRWVVSETASPVDYSPIVSATMLPRQRLNSGLNGLTIGCRARRIELSLRLAEDVDVPRFGEIQIASQINDQRSVKQRWIWDDDGIILTYVDDPMMFLRSIADGSRLRLGIGDSRGARHMAVYQLVDLAAVRKKVENACTGPASAQASSEKR